MEVALEYIEKVDGTVLWVVIGFVLLRLAFKRVAKMRDRKLIESVTSLHRGTSSERDFILKLLKSGVPKQTIFHDLCIRKSDGKFSQIDVVVVTTQGVIVFEVKDYSGWIFGSGNNSHWTKVLAYGKAKYRFYNPIKQNAYHIKAIKSQLKQFDSIPFFSVILFFGDCELKEITYVPKRTYLVKEHRVLEVLEQIKNNNVPAPYTDKRAVVTALQQAVDLGANLKYQKTHISNINDMLGKHRIFD